MKMETELRIATEAKYKEIYNNLKNANIIEDFHDLFFLCACIGYSKGKKSKILKREDRFYSRTITAKEWACYYSMLITDSDYAFESTIDEKELLLLIEQYANAGMEILMQDFLNDFLINPSKNTPPQLDTTTIKELPKNLIHFIFEQADLSNCESE